MNEPFRPLPFPAQTSQVDDDEQPARSDAPSAGLPTDLAALLATARASRAGEIAESPGLASSGIAARQNGGANTGVEHLLFVCANIPCATPLTELREALPALPRTTQLPFSAPWLLGIFPLRTEIIGLADPTPMLLGQSENLPLTEDEWSEWSAQQPWALRAEAALTAVGALAEPWRWGTWLHGGAVDVFGVSGARSQPGGGGGVRSYMRQTNQFATLFAAGGASAFTRALLLGEGARSLALVVNALGAISRAQPDELSEHLGDLSALPFQPRYVAGVYTPDERRQADDGADSTPAANVLPTGRRYLVLRLTTLLDDLLDALEQEAAL